MMTAEDVHRYRIEIQTAGAINAHHILPLLDEIDRLLNYTGKLELDVSGLKGTIGQQVDRIHKESELVDLLVAEIQSDGTHDARGFHASNGRCRWCGVLAAVEATRRGA